MRKNILFITFPLILLVFFFALSANATLIESGLPGAGQQDLLQPGQTQTTVTPSEYIRYLYLFVMGFVGIAGLVTLVIWGTVWAASGVIDKKAMAMEGIKNTLMGIGIALGSFVLLNTINPDLTIIKTPTLPLIPKSTNTTTPIVNGCNAGIAAKACVWTNTSFIIDCPTWGASKISGTKTPGACVGNHPADKPDCCVYK